MSLNNGTRVEWNNIYLRGGVGVIFMHVCGGGNDIGDGIGSSASDIREEEGVGDDNKVVVDEERSTKKNKVSGDGTVDRNEASNVKHDANDSDIVEKDSEGEDFDIDDDDRDLMLQSWICTRSSMGHSSKGTIGSSNSAGREWYHCCI